MSQFLKQHKISIKNPKVVLSGMPKIKIKKTKPDIVNKFTGDKWVYSKIVKSHFFYPKNFLVGDIKKLNFDVEGIIGSPACGDVMRVWLKIDPKTEKIKKFKWRTFGCASAIAATSILSVMVTEKGGMKIDRALKIKPQDIMKRLGGLPDRKIHCSVLGDKALRIAINNWFKKTEQYERIIIEGSRILDPNTKVTEADIEEAVLEGATTLEAVQKRTKVGIGYSKCILEVEELIKFYREKYYGPDKK
ncbi:MAG: iron-sulfur cluster assembly scaffold protein [Patescibacteria group bacterium]|nr:iron-sulfur cluster assembly scaffold protein [Patescibacteria group bacterium]